jgi:transposase
MIKFIGLDVHSATFTLVVLDEAGRVKRCCRKPTSAEALIDTVTNIIGDRHLILEESHMAQWVKTSLDPYVDRLVISDPVYNRWIAKDDFADDRSSATKLAELLRIGKIKEVYHPEDEQIAELRRLFCHYYHVNHQLTQCKNRLKATFRQVAALGAGRGIYAPAERERWLKEIGDYPALWIQARQLFGLIDAMQECKEQTKTSMVTLAKKQPGYPLLITFPGVGPVIASGYLAILVTPHRFSRRNKLWRYACFGNVRHESDGVIYKKGHSRTGNRPLKWLVCQQFQAAVHRAAKKPNRFKTKYRQLLASGRSERIARRQVCRNMLAAIQAAWKKGEPYRGEMTDTTE